MSRASRERLMWQSLAFGRWKSMKSGGGTAAITLHTDAAVSYWQMAAWQMEFGPGLAFPCTSNSKAGGRLWRTCPITEHNKKLVIVFKNGWWNGWWKGAEASPLHFQRLCFDRGSVWCIYSHRDGFQFWRAFVQLRLALSLLQHTWFNSAVNDWV